MRMVRLPTKFTPHAICYQQASIMPASCHGDVESFNGNVDKLNDLLFTHLDYAAIGERI